MVSKIDSFEKSYTRHNPSVKAEEVQPEEAVREYDPYHLGVKARPQKKQEENENPDDDFWTGDQASMDIISLLDFLYNFKDKQDQKNSPSETPDESDNVTLSPQTDETPPPPVTKAAQAAAAYGAVQRHAPMPMAQRKMPKDATVRGLINDLELLKINGFRNLPLERESNILKAIQSGIDRLKHQP